MLLFLVSCKDNSENLVTLEYDPEVTPSMVTDSAYQLLSDSGVTRYKVSYDVWMVFDKAKDPYQYFPKGIFLERFTPDFETEATVEGDTAWFMMRKSYGSLKIMFMSKTCWEKSSTVRSYIGIWRMEGFIPIPI